MNSACPVPSVGDLVWVPDKTCAWKAMTARSPSQVVTINGPRVALIKETHPLTILVNIEGEQETVHVGRRDVYDLGDLYD